MKTKKMLSAAAALGATLALALTACSGTVDTTSSSPTSSSSATDDTTDTPVVDRDPQGTLPEITFDADGIPTMTTVDADPPEVISVRTLEAGTGAVVGEGDYITVNYAGFLWSDGTQFDSSYDTGESVSFLLTEVIDGWAYGLAGTKVGDTVLLVAPSDYAYGDEESDTIPAGSTLVFVVEILDTLAVTTDALTEATLTGATLPEGVTVSGELGQEPTLVFAEDAPEPTESEVIVIAEGTGAVILETDTLLYHVVGAYWGETTSSSWELGYQQASYGGGEETVGQTVGSRLLLTYAADEDSGTEATAIVLDLVGVIPGE